MYKFSNFQNRFLSTIKPQNHQFYNNLSNRNNNIYSANNYNERKKYINQTTQLFQTTHNITQFNTQKRNKIQVRKPVSIATDTKKMEEKLFRNMSEDEQRLKRRFEKKKTETLKLVKNRLKRKLTEELDESNLELLLDLLHYHRNTGDVKEAELLFGLLKDHQGHVSLDTLNTMMFICLKADDFEKMHKYYYEMLTYGFMEDVETFNLLVQCSTQKGDYEAAIEYYEKMKSRGILPGQISVSNIITSCAIAGVPERGYEIYEDSIKFNVEPNHLILNALLNCCAHSGDVELAESYFMDVTKLRLPMRDEVLESITPVSKPFDVFDTYYNNLTDKFVSFDYKTFMGLIAVCGKTGNIEKAEHYYYIIKKLKFGVNQLLFNSMLTVASRAKNLEAANHYFNEMLKYNIAPNEVTMSMLRKVCERTGNYDKILHYKLIIMEILRNIKESAQS